MAQQLPASHYTIRDGLAQMQCISLLKDSRGYIWVGTKNGLNKFDGERFETFTTRDSLVHNYIAGLAEDSNRYIWVNNIRGLTRFDGRTFTKVKAPDGSTLKSLHIGPGGCPLTIIQKNGTEQLAEVRNGQFVVLPGIADKAQPVQAIDIVFVDSTRRRLCLSVDVRDKNNQYQASLWWYQNGKTTRWQTENPNEMGWGSSGKMTDGTIVLYSQNGQNTGLRTYYTIRDDSLIPFFQTNATTKQATVLRPIPADVVVPHNNAYHLLEKNQTRLTPLPLPTTPLWQYHFDQGGLWCATEKGLYRVWNNGFRYFTEEQVPYCWGVVDDRNGNLWFQNYRHSLMRFNGQTISRISGYEKAIQHPDLANDWYFHPLRDRYGHLWLTNFAGTFRYDGQRFQLITDPTQPETMCLFVDPARNLILKGGLNQVLFIQNKPPFRFTRFNQSNGFNDPNEYVLAMTKDAQGYYWFGGRNLTRYDYDRKKASHYTYENGKFPAKGVYSLCLDSRQQLWVASPKGLLRYDSTHDRFQRVLPDSVVSTVMLVGEFDKDHLIFADMKNLYVLDLAHFYRTGQVCCTVFNHFNGFMGLEPGQDGYYKDSQGYIWITSGSVLSRLDPRRIDLKTGRLQTRVAKVNAERLAFVGKPATINLPDGENVVTFTVETVGNDRPFFTEYSYRVPGFLDKWSPWQTQNLITLTNLPGGDYRIQIRSRSGSFGTRQPAETNLTFHVSLPFWKAPDFYQKVLFAFLVLSLLIGLLGIDWYQKQRRIRKQQQAIQNRGRQVQFLQVQTIQAQMNPHFLFNVLGTIQHLIVANDTEQAAANLLKLSHLMRNYLEASMLTNEEHGSLFAHEVPLAREIELLTMYIEFEKLQYGDRFTHEMIVVGKLNPESYQMPPLILQPYVENAIKHGLLYARQAGHLSIRFETIDEEELICTIEDNGVGRQRARELQQSSLKKYRSRGTELTNRRVELLNQLGYDILIETTDRPTGGTSVTIHIGYKPDSTP